MPLPFTSKTSYKKETHIDAPCGKCIYCLNSQRNDWTFRLWQESRHSQNSNFLTLTYDKESLRYGAKGPTLYKKDVQDFIKRLRKNNLKQWKEKIIYYAVGEYGDETERPHYHLIIFNVHPNTLRDLEKIWSHGLTDVGDVSPASIRYVTKYVINRYDKSDTLRQKPFSLQSQGIGKNYLIKNKSMHKRSETLYVLGDNGKKQKIPRYYSDKIWSDIEKRALKIKYQKKADLKHNELREKFNQKNQNIFLKELEHHEHQISQMEKKLNNKNKL